MMVPVVAGAASKTPERGKPRGSVSPLGVIPFRSTLRPTGRSRRRPKPLADSALPVRSQPESRFRWPLAGGPPPLAGGGPVGRSGNLAEPGPDPCGPVAAESVSLFSSEGNVGGSRRARLPNRLEGFRGRVRSFAFPRDPARAGRSAAATSTKPSKPRVNPEGVRPKPRPLGVRSGGATLITPLPLVPACAISFGGGPAPCTRLV